MVAQVRSSPIEDVKDENKKEEQERSVWFFTFFFIQGTDDFIIIRGIIFTFG